MSDFTGSEDEYDEEPRGLRKQIEEQAAKAREAEARAAAAERQLAFAKAGLDLSDPKMSYFVKGYDGESDPEKIKAAAQEAGFIGAPSQEPAVPAAELQQHQAAANLAAGSSNQTFVGPYDQDPEYQQSIRMSRSPDEVLAKVRAAGGLVMDDLDY
jgi:hypothetical protein